MSKITFKPTVKANQSKMGKDELQEYLKTRTQSGKFLSPKDYNRKDKSWRNE